VFVCLCVAVTEGEVRDCVRAGARTVEEVSRLSDACTGCGGCRETIEMILEDTGSTAPARMCA